MHCSAVFATVFGCILAIGSSQSLGDPSQLSSYPLCAQQCNAITDTYSSECSQANVTCVCQPDYRAQTAACEKVSCSAADYNKTQALALQLCGPVAAVSSVNPTSVSSAIVASTSTAAAAVASKDPTNLLDYPLCAQNCNNELLPQTDCGSLANRTCICNQEYASRVGACEDANCNMEDRETTRYLGDQLCNVPGVGNGSFASPTGTNNSATQTGPSVPPATFTGGAANGQGFASSLTLVSAVLLALVVF